MDRPTAPCLFVPVRHAPDGGFRVMFMRTPLGVRTAVAFTGERGLNALLGEGQPRIRLAEQALRSLAEPLGVRLLTVDPRFRAPAPRPGQRWSRVWEPDAAKGLIRVYV